MTTETTIKDAIARSVSHTEIVRVEVAAKDIAEALAEVSAHAKNYDHAEENDGDYDVWGTTESGDDFRIRVHLTAPDVHE